jgi:hypothetical protein
MLSVFQSEWSVRFQYLDYGRVTAVGGKIRRVFYYHAVWNNISLFIVPDHRVDGIDQGGMDLAICDEFHPGQLVQSRAA